MRLVFASPLIARVFAQAMRSVWILLIRAPHNQVLCGLMSVRLRALYAYRLKCAATDAMQERSMSCRRDMKKERIACLRRRTLGHWRASPAVSAELQPLICLVPELPCES